MCTYMYVYIDRVLVLLFGIIPQFAPECLVVAEAEAKSFIYTYTVQKK